MVFHVGCTLGSSFSSYAAGHVFENWDDKMAVWYINVTYTSVQVKRESESRDGCWREHITNDRALLSKLTQVASYFVLTLLFRDSSSSSKESNVSYSKLSQQDEVMILSDPDEEEDEEELR